MTVTYDITNNVGKVRLKIGDTDITDNVFTDEEIQYFITLHSDNLNLAAADLLEAWAAKYGAKAGSEHIGDYSYTQNIIDNMLKLAQKLKDTDANTPLMDIASMDLTAGSAIIDEEG